MRASAIFVPLPLGKVGLMIEIVANVHNVLTNHVSHSADTDIDFPRVDATLAEGAA